VPSAIEYRTWSRGASWAAVAASRAACSAAVIVSGARNRWNIVGQQGRRLRRKSRIISAAIVPSTEGSAIRSLQHWEVAL
jgi:hypothetical protein